MGHMDLDLKKINLEIDNQPDIQFVGELIASAESSDQREMGRRYSGMHGRWKEMEIYRTQAGKMVCHQINKTRWQNEEEVSTVKVCETDAEVIEFFGNCWVAKDLYEEAGIENVQHID